MTATHPKPPKKRDRAADGWQLIGFYMQHNGVVDMRDRDIAANLRPPWRNSAGVPDGDRVKQIRAHVTNRSRREQELGIVGADRVFSGWSFGYRDIKGSPSELFEGATGSLFSVGKGAASLLGNLVRFDQHTAEKERMVGNCREAATEAMINGYANLATTWLQCAVDIETFGQPRDATVDKLKELMANPS